MPTRRTTATLAAGALALAGLTFASATPSQAADSTPGYSIRHVSVPVKVGPSNDQTCTVDGDLYVPDGVDGSHKAPSILATNGFGGSKDDSNTAAIGKGFSRAGYVVFTYSGLGFGNTKGCKITLDDPAYDGKAGKQLVDVLAGTRKLTNTQTKSSYYLRLVQQEAPGDPRVGMIGGSYGGEIQFAVSEQDPRVDAIIPLITWNDLTYSLAPGDVAKKQWIDLFFGDGIASGVQSAAATQDPTPLAPPCPNFTDQACNGAVELNSQGYPSAATRKLARHASVANYMSRIKVPTLLVQGQADTLFNLNEATATFKALQRQGTPVRMVWQSWGHSDSTPAPGELKLDANSLRDTYLGNRFLDWMNHYVRGNSTAPVGPVFSYFRDWVKYDTSPANAGTAVAKAYQTMSSFPTDLGRRLYFTGNDGLTSSLSSVQAGSAQYGNLGPTPTSYSETSGVEGSQVNHDPSDAPGTFAAFTSPALTGPAIVVGSPKLTLHLDAPVAAQSQAQEGGRLVLFGKIYDVAPDGTKTLQHRLIAPLRVTDVTKPVTVTLPGIVKLFRAGHKIQVVVAASDMAYAGNVVPQPVTIKTSRSAPSSVLLPLTTGAPRF